MKAEGLQEVMEQKRVRDFGSDVVLAVGPPSPRADPFAASVNDLMRVERLERFMRAVKLEKDLWVKFLGAISATAQLESWTAHLESAL